MKARTVAKIKQEYIILSFQQNTAHITVFTHHLFKQTKKERFDDPNSIYVKFRVSFSLQPNTPSNN